MGSIYDTTKYKQFFGLATFHRRTRTWLLNGCGLDCWMAVVLCLLQFKFAPYFSMLTLDAFELLKKFTLQLKKIGLFYLLCRYHAIHKEVYKWFDINFDEFGRTSTPQQTEVCQAIFTKLMENNWLSENTMQQVWAYLVIILLDWCMGYHGLQFTIYFLFAML